jgi:transposase
MAHFVGLDVSVKETSVCVVDDTGKVILEQKVPTEPADIIMLLNSLGVSYGRIGIEAGPLSQWLVNALTVAELPVICVETRHMKALLTARQINKTDRNDARGIAQMMRVGLFKPVHVKTLVAQEELSPNVGDGLRVQAAAVWGGEDAGLAATSIPSVNLTP